MRVPLLDLHLQHQALDADLRHAIDKVLKSQHFILGEEVGGFEKAVGAYLGTPHAVGCASGSDALILALMAGGLQPGDGVITVPFTFFATTGAVSRLGGKTFFVDIDPLTFNMSPASLEAFLTKECEKRGAKTYHRRTGRLMHSVIPVHLFGQCAEMDPILKLAQDWHLLVIEDAAQAIGASYKGRQAGTMGDYGCYSFFPSKNLGAMGDGGLVVAKDPEAAERLRVLRVHGSKPKYFHKWVGMNSRLDTLQAAVLQVKLPHLDAWSQARRNNAAFYDAQWSGLAPELQTPAVAPNRHMIYNQYCVRTSRRDALKESLAKDGVGTEIYYPLCLHEQECFADLGYRKGDFPESERAAAEVLAVPVFPELTPDQRQWVADSLTRFFRTAKTVTNA